MENSHYTIVTKAIFLWRNQMQYKKNEQISNQYYELKEHGTLEFPFAFYHTSKHSADVMWHWHDEFEFSLMTKGSVPCHIGSDRFLLKEGEGLFINTGILHAISPSKGSFSLSKKDMVFHGRLVYGTKESIFWKKYLSPLIAAQNTLPYLLFRPNIPWEKQILDLIRDIFSFHEEKPEGYEIFIRDALGKIMVILYRQKKFILKKSRTSSSTDVEHVKRVLTYIQQHFEESITLKDLSAYANICEREIQRAFQNVTGLPPIQYLIHYRISKACEMLAGQNQTVTEVCTACGFSSPSYFTKIFKKINGITPSQYQKQCLSHQNNL